MPAAVTFDAYGTLLELDDPVGRLAAALADQGYPTPPEAVHQAFVAEVAVYRREQDLGRDTVGLEQLRTLCAATFSDALPARPPVAAARQALESGIRYRLYDDVRPTLDALADAGVRVGVVSNWDCSLSGVLIDLGIAERLTTVSISAVVGARKPDSRIFRHALDALGAVADHVIHVGDDPELDVAGARAAGLAGVLIDRSGGGPAGSIGDLREVLSRLPG